MKNRLHGILRIQMKDKWLAVLAVLFLIILLIPLYLCAAYAVPFYDDYNFIRHTRAFSIQYEHSYLWGAYKTMVQEWKAWQGTYATTYLNALNPLLYGEEYFRYGIIGVLVFFPISVITFTRTAALRLLGATKAEALILGAVITATLIELVYTAQEGFYWLVSAVHYTFMPGCMLLMLAAAIEIFYRKKTAGKILFMILATVCGILCAGSNYVSILQGLILLFTVFGLGILFRKKETFFLLLPLAAYTAGFFLNVMAPGNSVRASHFEGYSPVRAVLRSFVSAGQYFGKFTGWMMPVFLLLALPAAWNMVNRTAFRFRMPLLVSLYSVCLYATGFTASLYAMGIDPVARTCVPAGYTLQLLLFANMIYWLGWFAQKRKKRHADVTSSGHTLIYYAAVSALAVLVLFTTPDRLGSYSSYGAFLTLRSKEAQLFYQEYLDRIDTIKNGDDIIEVEPYRCRPLFLCIDDLSTDRYAARNISMANWYYKEGICLKETYQ